MKIKNLLYIGLFAGFISCNDAIEIDQPGRLSAEAAYQTVDDLQSGLFGVYNAFDTTPEIAFTTNFTDESAVGRENGGQGFDLFAFNLNAASTASSNFWVRNYAAINDANLLIEAAELIEPDADNQELYNSVLGQAYALRAYFYTELMSYYSTDYTDDSALGVPIIDFVPSVDIQPLRDTSGDVWAFISQDLTTAKGLISSQSNATYISKDFVTALQARIAAYRGRYSEALPLAMGLLNKYGIADRTQYEDMWFDEDNTEIIFKLLRNQGDPYDGQGVTGSVIAGGWAGARWAFTNRGIAGAPYFEINRALFNMLDMDDVRYDVIVHPSSIIDPDYPDATNYREDDILVVDKYPITEGVPLMADLKVFRSSEMLFIAAEAYADAGNLNGASNSVAALLKRLRDARFGTETALPVFNNQQSAFGAILDERRVELAFEGHRYKDLKRLGVRGNRGIDRDPLDCAQFNACTLDATDYRFTLPLPIVEFNANPGLREQQNPGYSGN